MKVRDQDTVNTMLQHYMQLYHDSDIRYSFQEFLIRHMMEGQDYVEIMEKMVAGSRKDVDNEVNYVLCLSFATHGIRIETIRHNDYINANIPTQGGRSLVTKLSVAATDRIQRLLEHLQEAIEKP